MPRDIRLARYENESHHRDNSRSPFGVTRNARWRPRVLRCSLPILVVAFVRSSRDADREPPQLRASSRWSRPRTSGAASPQQLGGDRVAGDQHHHQPGRRSARLRADRAPTRATMAGARMAIVNGIGYDPWARSCSPPIPTGGRVVLDVGDVARARRPATTRTSGTRRAGAAGDRPIDGRLRAADPEARRLLRRAEGEASRRRASPDYKRLIADDPEAATPARRSAPPRASSRRSPRRSASSWSRPTGFLDAISGGHRAHGRRQDDGRPADPRPADQGLGLQQPELDARRAAPERRGRSAAGIPVATVTETLTPGRGELPGVAGRASSRGSQTALREGAGGG